MRTGSSSSPHDGGKDTGRLSRRRDEHVGRLMHGSFWNLIATVAVQGTTFAANVIVARLAGKDAFGEYAAVYSNFVVVAAIAQLALGYTTTRYVSELRATNRERLGRVVTLCAMASLVSALLGTVVVLATATFVADRIYGAPGLADALRLGSPFVFFSVVSGFLSGLLAGLERWRSLAIASTVGALAQVLICIVGTLWWGSTGAVAALGIGAFLRTLIVGIGALLAIRAERISLEISGIRAESIIVSRFALPAAAAGFVSMPITFAINAMLVQSTDGFVQMATLAATMGIRQLAMFVPIVINNVGLPALSRVRGNDAEYRLVHRHNILWIVASAAGCALVVGLLGRTLLAIFGHNFTCDTVTLWILLASVVPESLGIGIYQHVQARDRMWESLFFINIPRELCFFAMSAVLIPSHGSQGVAMAYGAASLLGAASTLLVARIKPQAVAAI